MIEENIRFGGKEMGRNSLSVYYKESLTGLLIAQHCFLQCSNLYHLIEYLCIVVELKCVADRQKGVNTFLEFVNI